MALRPSIQPRPFLWMLSFALVVLAAIAVTRIVGLKAELETQVTRQLEAQVQDRVSTWESQLTGRLDRWLQDAISAPGNAVTLQATLRRHEPWFDSLYLWAPPPPTTPAMGPGIRPQRGRLLFPRIPTTEDSRLLILHPCLGRARLLAELTTAGPTEVAAQFIDGCYGESLPVRIRAAQEAADLLLRAGDPLTALAALDRIGLPPELPISEGIRQGLPPFRVVGSRTQRAQLLMALDRRQEALTLLYRTGAEISQLDAPQASGVLSYVDFPILSELESHGRRPEAERLKVLLGRAKRRERAWREIDERVLSGTTPQMSTAPRFIYDQYAETPFLLYYGSLGNPDVSGGIVLDQPMLIADFLQHMSRLQRDVVVIGASGERIEGSHTGGDIRVQVPFTQTLAHLRVGIRQSAIDAEISRYGNQWLVPLVVTGICVLLGLAGMSAQIRASNRQRELLVRQREFTTRITHELKTPLAGIKVMAENLELGAWRSPAHREEMARRIVDEADRLTTRVDEILSIGRERTIPQPVVFDPEEPILEAIEEWGPRLHQAGVTLTADLHGSHEVRGDPRSIRDAVSCLLDNALKYRDEQRAEPHVWLRLIDQGKWVVIDVADNGLGVPRAMRTAIFQRFVRVEGPNRGRAGGHGLGLAQVAEIVRIHRGTIGCSEGVAGGARFIIRLPRYE